MVMILKRLLANFIDVFVFLASVVAHYVFILPFFDAVNEWVFAAVALVAVIVFNTILQYPFLKVNQTIGKAFFRLKVISTNPHRPLSVSIMVQREVFAKAFTCYFMCLPVFFNAKGQHDVACETEVVDG